jgi:RND superfamily putative drug exporter
LFAQIGRFAFRFRFVVVLVWAALAVGAVLFAPSLAVVGVSDEASLLPRDAESVEAQAILATAFPEASGSNAATLVFTRPAGLTDADRAYIADVAGWLTSNDAPATVRTAVSEVLSVGADPGLAASLQSPDGKLELVQAQLAVAPFQTGANDAVAAMRDHLAQSAPAGLEAHVTGTAGLGADYITSIVAATERTTIVTVLIVLVLLLLIYRAPLAALLPLLVIGIAFLVSRGLLGYLAEAGWQISSLLDAFLVVLVFGVGTDYTIFLISRFREEVHRGPWSEATATTTRRIGAVITASAATVVVGFLAMAVARFGLIQSTGPALAITIVVTLIVSLTLTPALLGIFGHHLYWPFHEPNGREASQNGFWARVATLITERPGPVALVVVVLMAIPLLAVPQMHSNFDLLAELPATADSRQGFTAVGAHMDGGKLFPVSIAVTDVATPMTDPANIAATADLGKRLLAIKGVGSVISLAAPTGGDTPAELRPSDQLRQLAEQLTPAGGDPSAILRDPQATAGLDAATAYLVALGTAFPDLAAGTAFSSVRQDLEAMRSGIEGLRTSAHVGTQLSALADALGSPSGAAAGAGPEQQLAALGGYLSELAAAYPDVAGQSSYADALTTLAAIQAAGAPTPALVTQLEADLRELAATFADKPDALLFPTSLPPSEAASAAQAALAEVMDRLPGELTSLADVFAARPDDYFLPVGREGEAGAQATRLADAFWAPAARTGQLILTINDDPYSPAAFSVIRAVRAELATGTGLGPDARAYVGGTVAQFADIETTISEDFLRVAILTLLGVFVVLVLLLRSLVAPVYLMLTVLLSYGTSMGIVTWLFQDVLGQAGVSYFIPLLVFVLLIALGADYNIFLMSRIREESEDRPVRAGIRIASARTGAVITAAGLILAGTFASLVVAPLQILFQVGVAVAIGVLIDALVVRSLLVPSITALLGERSWWPSRGGGQR